MHMQGLTGDCVHIEVLWCSLFRMGSTAGEYGSGNINIAGTCRYQKNTCLLSMTRLANGLLKVKELLQILK